MFSAPDADGIPQIWTPPPGGGADPRPITTGPARKSLPQVTGEGRHVLYVVNEDGTPRLRLMDADGSNDGPFFRSVP